MRILVDHMFSNQDRDTVAFLAAVHPNFELKHYPPALSRLKPSLYHTFLAALRSFRDLNQRMHNEVMLVDDAVLLTSGRRGEESGIRERTRSQESGFRSRERSEEPGGRSWGRKNVSS